MRPAFLRVQWGMGCSALSGSFFALEWRTDLVPVLGVVGTLVWDRILERDGRRHPVEEWGGVAYALSALAAALPEGWTILPILKVGRDLSEPAFHFLKEIPGLRDAGIVVVPEPNNRVELRYLDAERRTERILGGVPPWTWPELAPLVEITDALYVNFISGFEMDLDTATALRRGYPGPMYGDLHSLFLSVTARGVRVPTPLGGWRDWLRCFDAVQMNDEEFRLLGHQGDDPWALVSSALGPELKLVTVTLGGEGVAYTAAPGFTPDPMAWSSLRTRVGTTGPARSGRVEVPGERREGDPTGCGDVWGATFYARLLGGDDLEPALRIANEQAARNVEHRGARGLYRYLKGGLSHMEETL
ncbi:MAG: carbohydrate kinase family protein [Gemmatimonadota bacterium]